MLDIKFIRENQDLVKVAAKKRRVDFDVEEFLKIDEDRRSLMKIVEEKRAEHKGATRMVAGTSNQERRQILIEQMRAQKAGLEEQEDKLKRVMTKWQELMLRVPNVPDISVPDGKDESENQTVTEWGQKPQFAFPPKDHVSIMNSLRMVDFERGVKTHGFRGYFLTGDGAELSWALWNYARAFFSKKNFTPIVAPSIVKKPFFYGTGHLPNEAEDLFKTQDDDYLSGTAEVPMMAYHSDEVLNANELPKRYLAFSTCFRREAGSYGKDTKGLIRVHEFFKFEQLIISIASHEDSVKFHEEINRNYEEFLESLKLPYRRLLICSGDLGTAKVKQYDTEIWFPSQNAYREGSSASYYHDFQTRRFNIRYKDGDKNRYCYSLNSTAVATPRIIAAIVENYQHEDGSVKIPEVLTTFMGKEVITRG